MQNVAENRDMQSVERIFAITNSQGVEQGLCRMLVRSVSRVYNRNAQALGYEFRSTRRTVANNDAVGTHGFQGPDGVEQRFPFFQAGRFGLQVHGVRAEPGSGGGKTRSEEH